MRLVSARLKLISLLLIAAILCAGCEVPDITEFTRQSAEMTRGIRTGVKDTEGLIKAASERPDLYSPTTIEKLKKDLNAYQQAIKPTVEALNALDSYLEALNALSQANKKSGENATAAVNAVTNLVTAVSGFTFASSVVNVAGGLLTLAERFRTAKAFKQRVNLSAEIVEGKFVEARDANGDVSLDENGKPKFVKACTGNAEQQVTEAGRGIKELVDNALKRAFERPVAVTEAEKEEAKKLEAQKTALAKPMSPEERRALMRSFNILTADELEKIQAAESRIVRAGCGVIDLLRFNISDLRQINQAISNSVLANLKDKGGPVLSAQETFRDRRDRIRLEVTAIVASKNLVSRTNELIINHGSQTLITRNRLRLKTNLDDLFARDSQLKKEITEAISDCGTSCGRMSELLTPALSLDCDDACIARVKGTIAGITAAQFDQSIAIIEGILDSRKDDLVGEDQKLASDLDRLKPDFEAVTAELNRVAQKRDQLDSLLNTSTSALKTWANSHANLRVAVNTKKPLTVSKLTSEVREIWETIQPKSQ